MRPKVEMRQQWAQAKRETEFKKELEPKFEASLRQVGIGA